MTARVLTFPQWRDAASRLADIEHKRAEKNRRAWDALPVDLQRAKNFMRLARRRGCDFWFSSPETIEIGIPPAPELPAWPRAEFKLLFILNTKAIAALLEEEQAQ